MYCNPDGINLINDINDTDDGIESCDIMYGLWKCKNVSSICHYGETDYAQQYILCDEDNSCNEIEYECDERIGGDGTVTNPGACNIICSGTNSCNKMNVVCARDKICNLICSGNSSCLSNIIGVGQPTRRMTNDVNIICGTSNTNGSCLYGTYNIFPTVTAHKYIQITVNSMGTYNLYQTQINIQYHGWEVWTEVRCNNVASCQGT